MNKEAIMNNRLSILADQNNASAINNLAMILYDMGQKEESLEHLEKLLV